MKIISFTVGTIYADPLNTAIVGLPRPTPVARLTPWCRHRGAPRAGTTVDRATLDETRVRRAARIDNLASCHAALTALLASNDNSERTRAIVLYDHEEVGSRSAQGAASDFLRSCLQRLSGNTPEDFHRAIARSFLISADMAHAVHPNHPDRHEPGHRPQIGLDMPRFVRKCA